MSIEAWKTYGFFCGPAVTPNTPVTVTNWRLASKFVLSLREAYVKGVGDHVMVRYEGPDPRRHGETLSYLVAFRRGEDLPDSIQLIGQTRVAWRPE